MPTAKKVKISSSYDVHPSLAMYQSTLAGLKQKTGKSLEEWITLVKKSAPPTEKERREWLQASHGLGRNYASFIAEQSVGKGDDGTEETYLKQADEYVEKMYSGAKEALRPIFERADGAGTQPGQRCKSMSVPDDGAALSQTRFRADQTNHTHAHRSGPGAQRYESSKTAYRYRRV